MITTRGSLMIRIAMDKISAKSEPICGIRLWSGHSRPIDAVVLGRNIVFLNSIVSGFIKRVIHLWGWIVSDHRTNARDLKRFRRMRNLHSHHLIYNCYHYTSGWSRSSRAYSQGEMRCARGEYKFTWMKCVRHVCEKWYQISHFPFPSECQSLYCYWYCSAQMWSYICHPPLSWSMGDNGFNFMCNVGLTM